MKLKINNVLRESMKKNQKNIFLETEGDAWFERNKIQLSGRVINSDDQIIKAIDTCLKINRECFEGLRLLEIGCGDGSRLSWLNKNRRLNCSGVDPSTKAVRVASDKGIHSIKATADKLPFENNEFDIVIFGFCLYLCDIEDLFQISKEADRVLKKVGWIIIHDFYSKTSITKTYKHCGNVNSHKMDFRKLFDWHPAYTCYSHEVKHHENIEFTDEVNEWVGLSILRKNLQGR